MFTKPISQLTFEDVKNLVEIQRVEEGFNLDYKKEIVGQNIDKSKRELAKDVSAFSNSSGGYLIIGVSNDKQILGIDSILNNRPVVEWMNQVLNSNIIPGILYHDPKIIPIPESDKVLVVVQIPESSSKPHMVKDEFCYYVRVNDSSRTANHYQVRDMFEISRNRMNELQAFLEGKNLVNIKSKDFGNTNVFPTLYNLYFKDNNGLPLPKILFSLIPKNIGAPKNVVNIEHTKTWLEGYKERNSRTSHVELFYINNNIDPKLDGFTIKHRSSNYTKSYFEVYDNGYVEAGFSESIFGIYQRERKDVKYAHLTSILAYEIELLKFAREYYDFIKYHDEVILQISFINVRDFTIEGLYGGTKYRSFYDAPVNKSDPNFKILLTFLPQSITNDEITKEVTYHSVKLCNAFGYEQNVGIVDGKIDLAEVRFFSL